MNENEQMVTTKQIAQACGVRPVTVRQWRKRHGDFPQPRHVFGDTYVYDAVQMDAWLDAHHKEHTPLDPVAV